LEKLGVASAATVIKRMMLTGSWNDDSLAMHCCGKMTVVCRFDDWQRKWLFKTNQNWYTPSNEYSPYSVFLFNGHWHGTSARVVEVTV
jgi:hypothetical protein